MSNDLELTIQALKERYGAKDIFQSGQHWLVISSDQLVAALQALRDEFAFDYLASLTAVDEYPAEEPRFHVVYQLHSLQHNMRIGVRVPLDGSNPSLPTVEGLFPVANWHEREVYDMFGICFEGHSDLRRIIMPHDWVGHPLRKDYPLGYEEPQFTFNREEIQARKHQARYDEA
jgi:NADH-quinone oxidoreductase subunit C